jgi:hypothetical protein
MIYNQMLSFAAGILVARVIGASQYGVVSVARNILEVLGIVSPLGLDLALQRRLGSGQRFFGRLLSCSGLLRRHWLHWGWEPMSSNQSIGFQSSPMSCSQRSSRSPL